jgi:hypothetical protein
MNVKQITLLLLALSFLLLLFGAQNYLNARGETTDEAVSLYAASGHANQDSLAFTYWEDNNPPVVPTACARCHSTQGLLDYLGEGAAQPGQVDEPAPSGEGVQCIACHNPTAQTLETVVFHSGVEFQPGGREVVCMVCHQTRNSTRSIEASIEGLEPDEVDEELSFLNPHYHFAASTQLGTLAHSGYEYPGREYAGFFNHATMAQRCIDCHSPHGLKVEPSRCSSCHSNVVSGADFRNIREQNIDFDGDGNTSKGIHAEILALEELLFTSIQEYAQVISGEPIAYINQFPYFIHEDAQQGQGANSPYNAWTPRLVKAAYNYQFSRQDLGGYVHNPRYMLQLLYDSLLDLQDYSSIPVENLNRP